MGKTLRDRLGISQDDGGISPARLCGVRPELELPHEDSLLITPSVVESLRTTHEH
jgi:hypothetical protein